MITLDKSLISTRVNENQYIKGAQNSTKTAEKLVPESTIAQSLRIQRIKAKVTTKSATNYFNASLKLTREERIARSSEKVIKFGNW